MLVADTSAFISLGIADVLPLVLTEYDVHTTQCVVSELEERAAHEDIHGQAASTALDRFSDIQVHDVRADELETSRVDAGEATCVAVARSRDAAFLITDDLRALPELQRLTEAQVAISPILLRALVKQGCLTNPTAEAKLETLVDSRDWLGTPIYQRARQLFEE